MLSDLTVAIAGGKGGTGKTTVSSNLARAASRAGCEVYSASPAAGILMCRCRLWTKKSAPPCGLCSEICQYSAIVCLDKTILTFDKMCHGCGGCALPAGMQGYIPASFHQPCPNTGGKAVDCGNAPVFVPGAFFSFFVNIALFKKGNYELMLNNTSAPLFPAAGPGIKRLAVLQVSYHAANGTIRETVSNSM